MSIEIDSEKDENILYSMKLHEGKSFSGDTLYITRVIGGWIYNIIIKDSNDNFVACNSVFVSFVGRGSLNK